MSTLRPTTDLVPARWLVDSVTGFGPRVHELMPPGFDGCVRIFHRPDQGLPDEDSATSWAEVARRHGTVVHPAAQYRPLTERPPDHTRNEAFDGDQPLEGSLDRLTLPLLASHLAERTITPETCHLAVWHGFGSMPDSWQRYPVFALPAREHWLFPPAPVRDVTAVAVELDIAGFEEQSRQPGGIRGVTQLGVPERPFDSRAFLEDRRRRGDLQSPTWWWPDDHAWVVHSEIDLDSTLVAGSAALCDALLADPGIECLAVGPDVSLALVADTVNHP